MIEPFLFETINTINYLNARVRLFCNFLAASLSFPFGSCQTHTHNKETSCMLVVFLPCDCEKTGEGEKEKSIRSQIGEILPITLPVSHSTHFITDTALVPAHPLQTHTRWQEVHTNRRFALICCLFSCTVIVLSFLRFVWHNIMIYFYHRSLFLSNRHQLNLNPL